MSRLISECDGMVDATVKSVETVMGTIAETEQLGPVTNVRLSISNTWLGPPVAKDLTITHPGGTLGQKTLSFSLAPDLHVGDRAYVFLGRYAGQPSACSGAIGVFLYAKADGSADWSADHIQRFLRRIARTSAGDGDPK